MKGLFDFRRIIKLNQLRRSQIIQQIDFNKGCYFWFASSDALGRMLIDAKSPNLYHYKIQDETYHLVYIGIGPRNEDTKGQFIQQRIVNCHLGNKISNSTFRLSVASLIGLNCNLRLSGNTFKAFMNVEDEQALTTFITESFVVCIQRNETPWSVEKSLIQEYQPPLNLQHNANGWYYDVMKQRRIKFLQRDKH